MTAQNDVADGLDPIPGEAGIPSVNSPRRSNVSWKAVVSVGLMALAVAALAATTVRRLTASNPAKEEAKAAAAAPKPVAATTKPASIDVPPAVTPASAPGAAALVPAIEPGEEDADPIPVRGHQAASGRNTRESRPKGIDPTDAPMMVTSDGRATAPAGKAPEAGESDRESALRENREGDPLAQTRAGLRDYRAQLQDMMQNLKGMTNAVKGRSAGAGATAAPLAGAAAAPGQPATEDGQGAQAGGAARVAATSIGNRSLTLPKGTVFTCALKTQVIASASGPVSCQVMRNVYSDDGRVLLIERGSHVDGEYKMQNVRPGMVAIPAIWTRLRMPNGVVVALDSPATGPLGAAGIDGVVDNRWPERLGAALMVSLIGDSIQIAIADQQDGATMATTSGTYAQTTSTTGSLADEVLKSTINLPPILYKNQGGVVGVYVSRDVDFGTVYALRIGDEHH